MSEKKIQVETRGSDIEAAVQAGLSQLGLARTDVLVDVVDEGSRGLLGIGARDAVVRLTVLRPELVSQPVRETPKAPEPKVETAVPAVPEPAPVAAPPKPKKVEPKPIEPVKAPEPDIVPVLETAKVVQETAVSEPETQPEPVEPAQEQEEQEQEPRDEAERDLALQMTNELLEKLYFDAEVTSELSEPDDMSGRRVDVIKINGEELGNLIGPRGETLNSLQYILRLMVGHKLHKRADFVLDIEGYRQKREQALSKLAERMAKKVIGRQRAMTLEPMPPHERRIIHMTLRNHKKVYTESVGEGKRRKVRIFPQR